MDIPGTLKRSQWKHLKMDGWNMIVSFSGLFSEAFAVSFRECNGWCLDYSTWLDSPFAAFKLHFGFFLLNYGGFWESSL